MLRWCHFLIDALTDRELYHNILFLTLRLSVKLISILLQSDRRINLILYTKTKQDRVLT